METTNNLISLGIKLKNGEKVNCLTCKEGYYEPLKKDPDFNYGYKCNLCGEYVNIDPIVEVK